MDIRRAISLGLAGLFLGTGAALAADNTDPCWQLEPSLTGAPHGWRAWRAATRVIDDNTGTAMRLSRLQSGAFQVDITGDGLNVRKTLHANGDFDLALRANDDLLTVGGRGGHLRVSRRGQTVDIESSSLAEGGLDQLQELLAGSAAVRRFRAMRSMLTLATRCTGPGVAVDIIDMMIGALKGEAPVSVAVPAAPMMSTMSSVSDEEEADGSSCYDAWVTEVVASWSDYEGCIYSFAWYNPLREVCAFAWVIRVESAWFRLIGCSSFPLKLEA